MNAEDGEDSSDHPCEFCAATVQLYDFAGVSSVTLIGDAAPVAVLVVPPDGLVQVARYPVIGAPPLNIGGANDTAAVDLSTNTVGLVGASGTEIGVKLAEGADSGDHPAAFCAETVQV